MRPFIGTVHGRGVVRVEFRIPKSKRSDGKRDDVIYAITQKIEGIGAQAH